MNAPSNAAQTAAQTAAVDAKAHAAGSAEASSLPWQLYALKYAQFTSTRAHSFLGGVADDGPLEMAYYVWLAKRGSEAVLIDTGFSKATAERRKRNWLRCPVESLALLGVPCDAISDLIVTHLHYDHAGNLDKAPNARLHLQSRELQFATSRYMCVSHISLGGVFEADDVCTVVRENFAGRLNLIDGEAEIKPGIRVYRAGGHTPGMQMVSVDTQRGRVIVMSDCAHLYENIAAQKPFHIVFDLADMMRGWRDGVDRAPTSDHVIPGHDPQVLQVYPAVPGLEGIAVKLHEAPARSILPERRALLRSLPDIAQA